jgi:hypothetical protein
MPRGPWATQCRVRRGFRAAWWVVRSGFQPEAAVSRRSQDASLASPVAGLSPCWPSPAEQKNWIFGSSQVSVPREHLVIRGSPRPVHDYATALGVLGLDPAKRVRVGGWITLHGWRARWVFVPLRGNESIFLGHLALVWTTGGHTYAVGFHDWNPRAVTRAMDLELVRHIRLVES